MLLSKGMYNGEKKRNLALALPGLVDSYCLFPSGMQLFHKKEKYHTGIDVAETGLQ